MPDAEVRVIIDDPRGVLVDYREHFLDPAERRALFAELDAAKPLFGRDQLRIFGRTIPSPRLVCAFGDPGLSYRYSGVDRATQPWPAQLLAARDRIAELVGQPFSYALVNLYRDGHDRLGWHSDAESDIVRDSTIASLSLGAARPFQLRGREKGSSIHEVVLADGSLLLMRGATQRLYKHQLPARARVRGPRFNITLRQVRER